MEHAAPRIEITVQYVGHHDFNEAVAADVTFHKVKLGAMTHFGIEPSAADRYVLQHDGADLSETATVSALHAHHAVLVLALKQEPVKGC